MGTRALASAEVEAPTPSTRDRILEAALLRFACHNYEAAGLRDIADDVGVDVAYVHRCFGSKEKLFAAVLDTAFESEQKLRAAESDIPASLARQISKPRTQKSVSEVKALDILARSFSSTQASRVVRRYVSKSFIEPLSQSLGHANTNRAALLASFFAGVAIFRNVLKIDNFQNFTYEELESIVAELTTVILNSDSISEPKQCSCK